jgi:hypothetical protein
VADEQDEYSSKQALAELQDQLGPEQTAICEKFASIIIGPILHQQGDNGKALLGYMSIKIASLMEDW